MRCGGRTPPHPVPLLSVATFMRVLVTGGTGYLGSAIVRHLDAARHEAVVFARSAASSGLPGHLFTGDVRDLDALRLAARGCDAICHTAALVSLWRPRAHEFDDINVGGLANVIRAASELRIARIVYTSSFLALPPTGATLPQRWNDYQRTKVAADLLAGRAVASGIPLVRLYPGVIYGPGVLHEANLVGRQIADHLRGRLPGIIGAARRWSYAYIDDVAEAHVAALERGRPGAQYHLSGETARQMRVFEIVRDITGHPLPRRIPMTVAVALALVEELRTALFRTPPRLTLGTVEILERDWMLDSSVAERDLGYQVTPLEAGVAQVVSELWDPDPAANQAGPA
jgi:farnesol dehydrogenase